MSERRQKAAARETIRRTQIVTQASLDHNIYWPNWSAFKLFLHNGGGNVLHGGYCMTSVKFLNSLELFTEKRNVSLTTFFPKHCKYFHQVWCSTICKLDGHILREINKELEIVKPFGSCDRVISYTAVKGVLWHFGKYAYSLSGREFKERIDTTLTNSPAHNPCEMPNCCFYTSVFVRTKQTRYNVFNSEL